MKNGLFSRGVISSNALKLIAMISMTIDHVGLHLLDNSQPCRIIGRLAFPIFAYLIAEGCYYTKNKLRHFLEIFLLGALCQAVYFLESGSFYMNVLLTFSLSIPVIYSIEYVKKKQGFSILPLIAISGILFICIGIPKIFPEFPISFDYGLPGIMLPILISIPKRRDLKLAAAEIGILAICTKYGTNQWFSLAALVPLALYNGKRGKFKFKYAFYIFYPLHLAIIYLIEKLI